MPARKVTGGLKLFHDKFAKNPGEFQEYAAQFDEALRHNEQLRSCISKVTLNPKPGDPNPKTPNNKLIIERWAMLNRPRRRAS